MGSKWVASVGTALVLLLSPCGAAQEREGHVFVTALDADGVPLEGLTAAHFAIREGGRDREVLRVEPLRTPMHVSVLVDSSIGNGAPDEAFRSALDEFVVRLASVNHVAVYSFGNRATAVAPFSQDAVKLRAAMVGMFAASPGGSYLIDGIELALKDLRAVESPRPVIVAIASEAADASRRTAGAVVKQLIANTTAFHAISLASATGSSTATTIARDIPSSSQRLQGMIALGEGDRERTRALQQGTSVTGGSLQRVTSTAALAPALSRVARELAGGYVITFSRPGSDAMKDLQVGIMADGVTLRATPAPRR